MKQRNGKNYWRSLGELQETEEFKEFNDALDNEPDVNQLKELADLVYVAFQFAAARGWDLDRALDRVHKSNMSKLVDGKPLRREDGKV